MTDLTEARTRRRVLPPDWDQAIRLVQGGVLMMEHAAGLFVDLTPDQEAAIRALVADDNGRLTATQVRQRLTAIPRPGAA